jgi:hypothetical protein
MQDSISGQLFASCLGSQDAIISTLAHTPDARDGRFVVTVEGGEVIGGALMPENAVVIDPYHYGQIFGLLKCMVPPVLLQTVLQDLGRMN